MILERKQGCLCSLKPSQTELVLTDEQRAEVATLTDLPPHDSLVRHPEEFFLKLREIGRKMPEAILASIDAFKMMPDLHKQGFIVIGNLPYDNNRTTPRWHGDPICDPKTTSEWVNMLISSQLGYVFSLANEYNGRYPNPIAPQENKQEEASSASSLRLLGWHQDLIAMGKARADWLVLTCVKAAPPGTGATTLASACDVVEKISPAAREILRQPIFTIDAPASCKGAICPIVTAILGGSDSEPHLTYQDGGTRPLVPDNEAAQMAIRELVEALNNSRRDIYLSPGDTLIFRNGAIGWNVAHGRSIFSARFDNTEFKANRFLVRSYVLDSIFPIQQLRYPNSRVLVPTSLYRAAYA